MFILVIGLVIGSIRDFFSQMFVNDSSEAEEISALFKDYLIIAAIILLIVAFLVVGGLIIYRDRKKGEEPEQISGNRGLELLWTIVPLVVVTVLFLLSLKTMKEINEPVIRGQKPDIVIIAHQWWWDFRYPQEHVITANELHIPAGEKLLMRIESADVIHSWWVPSLGRKIDAVPGRLNYGWLDADTTGIFLGTCSEYCGTQHATMGIRVVSESPASYEKWLATQRMQPKTPTDSLARAGAEIFQHRTCGNCHAISGTPAEAHIGPDLTHVASRTTLLSGLEKNTPEHIRAWLDNPQQVKKGARMPDFLLTDDELNALTAYLTQLH
ncbi:MAG: cytochrome c oxidase subunit II [Bacteroidales bacterium]